MSNSTPKHSRLRRWLASSAAATVMVAGLSLGAATPAFAGTCTDTWFGQICGVVKNSPYSATSIRVGEGWNGYSVTRNIRTLSKGQSSSAYMKDADGVYIPSGYCGRIGQQVLSGGRWHKLFDNSWTVLVSKQTFWGC